MAYLNLKQFLSPVVRELDPVLVREISWSNNLLIMVGCKTDQVRELADLADEGK